MRDYDYYTDTSLPWRHATSLDHYITLLREQRRRKDFRVEYDPPVPKVPTNARPGSREKVEVFRKRVQGGEALCHPMDRRDYKPKKIHWTVREGADPTVDQFGNNCHHGEYQIPEVTLGSLTMDGSERIRKRGQA